MAKAKEMQLVIFGVYFPFDQLRHLGMLPFLAFYLIFCAVRRRVIIWQKKHRPVKEVLMAKQPLLTYTLKAMAVTMIHIE